MAEERMMQLEAERRAHELRLTQMEVDSHASAERIQGDSLEIAKAVKGFTTKWTYAAFGVALAVLLVAIVAAVFTALSYFHSLAPPPTP